MIQCSTSSNAARKLHAVAIFAIQPDQFNRATTHRTSLQIPCQEQSPTHRSSPANHHRPATLLPQWPSEAQRQPSLLPTSGHRTVQSLSRSKVTQFFSHALLACSTDLRLVTSRVKRSAEGQAIKMALRRAGVCAALVARRGLVATRDKGKRTLTRCVRLIDVKCCNNLHSATHSETEHMHAHSHAHCMCCCLSAWLSSMRICSSGQPSQSSQLRESLAFV
jgi:hypothetical protein